MQARQEPTWEQAPAWAYTDGPDACEVAACHFGEPMAWQRHVLDVLLARDARDKYCAHTAALSIPRQNGKSWAVRARCLYGAVMDGERILYTCQHGDTANEMFAELSAPFEDEDNEELRSQLLAVRKTNGQQAIRLANGGAVRFTTRTNSLVRGRSFDVLIYDEAQDLTRGQQAASLPAIAASKTKNTQVIYIGTPPGPDVAGDIFATMHDDVHAGLRPRVAWMEWAAAEVGSKDDRARWWECNPSLGAVLDLAAVEGEADQMDPDDFARERLGWWSPRARAARAIDQRAWEDTAIAAIGGAYGGVTCLGLKFSADGSRYALAGCKASPDRRAAAFELVETGRCDRGTRALAEALSSRAGRVSCVAVDGGNPATSLCDRLADLGAPRGYVVRMGAREVVGAASLLLDALDARQVAHTRQPALDDSALGCARRAIGRGGWGLGPSEAADSTAIEACAAAYWAARTTRRDPGRRQRAL